LEAGGGLGSFVKVAAFQPTTLEGLDKVCHTCSVWKEGGCTLGAGGIMQHGCHIRFGIRDRVLRQPLGGLDKLCVVEWAGGREIMWLLGC
jgi:hypothetical protein